MFQPQRTLCCHKDTRIRYKQLESLDIGSLLSARVKTNKPNTLELHYLLYKVMRD